MGFVSSLLGIGGSGSNFQAQGVNPQDLAVSQELERRQAASQASQYAQAKNQNGYLNQSNVFGQQQALAGQLGQMAQGQGPNPAQAALNQSTGQNIASQAALMAGQRGAGANPGMVGRNIAQQGGALQQQAVGQGATLQAQQQLAAIQALQQQQGLLASTSGQQVAQQQAQGNAVSQNVLGNQGQIFGMQANQNSANAGVQQQNAKSQAGVVGGILNGIGSAIGLSQGGNVPQSKVGMFLANVMKDGGKVAGKSQVKGDSPKNDTVPAMLSPGEIVVPRSAAGSPDKAAAFAKAVAMRSKSKGKK